MDASYLWCPCLWTFQEWVTEGLILTVKWPKVVTQVKEEDEGRIRGPCWVRLRGLIDEEPLTQYSWSIFKAASHMLCIGYGQVGAPRTSASDLNWTVRGAIWQAPPLCLVDMIMTVISMLIGSVVFALTIAEITSLIQSMNSSASSYKEKLTQVKVRTTAL